MEGALALRALSFSPHRARSVLVSPSGAARVGADADALGCPVFVADREVLRSVTGFDVHRGVLAAACRPQPQDPDDLAAATLRTVIVEGVNDNENIGALFRTAAALGIDAVLLDRRSADPLYRRSIRVSQGWTMRLPFARVDDVGDALAAMRRRGSTVVALTPSSAAPQVDRVAAEGLLDDPVSFIVGSEGAGLRDETMAAADTTVRIPMAAGVDSLNVATSLAVVASFAAAARRWS